MIKVSNIQNLRDDEVILPSQMNSCLTNKKQKIQLPSYSSLGKTSSKLSSRNGLTEDQILLNEQSSNGLIKNDTKSISSEKINKQTNKNLQLIAQTMHLQGKKNRKQQPFKLKQVIKQQKTKLIVKNFITKLARNNMNSKPIDYNPFPSDEEIGFSNMEGFQLNQIISNVMAILSVIQIVVLTLVYSLSIVFQQVNNFKIVTTFQTFSLVFYLIQICVNLVTIKQEEGKRVTKLSQIFEFYLKTNFPIDCISLIILVIDLSFSWQATNILRLFIIIKLFQVLQKVQKLQVYFVSNFHKEQYWSLIKVFIFNFCFAHILAITLLLMSKLNSQNNWMHKKGIQYSPWIQQYVWSYYWGTTIMLTVGFGDLCPITYQQAIVLTFIQMISCMALAYNINCVGTLISNIRSQDLEKSKNFKVFRKLAEKNNVTDDLQWRINNYIEESSNIRKKFNYEQQNNFVLKLPKGLKTEFLKQSNKKIFQNLPFFKNLMERTLFNFAQRIQMRICHPEEVAQTIQDNLNLMILKGGQIGFSVKKSGCDFNAKVIDKIQIKETEQPFLINLNFIRKNRKIFEIISLEYSILYCLDYDNIINILKGSEMDYQLYCLLRDKSSHIPDEFQLFKCQLCQKNHTKFTCPKIHFIPFTQQTINKYLHKVKNSRSKRTDKIGRHLQDKKSALKIFLSLSMEAAKKNTCKNFTKTRKKLQNSFDQKRKKFESIQQASPSIGRQFQQIKNFFSQNTAQLIKTEVGKILKSQQSYDQVWNCQTDKMKNYKSYFQNDNSCNLIQKFSVSKRMSNQPSNDVSQGEEQYLGLSKNNITCKSFRQLIN